MLVICTTVCKTSNSDYFVWLISQSMIPHCCKRVSKKRGCAELLQVYSSVERPLFKILRGVQGQMSVMFPASLNFRIPSTSVLMAVNCIIYAVAIQSFVLLVRKEFHMSQGHSKVYVSAAIDHYQRQSTQGSCSSH